MDNKHKLERIAQIVNLTYLDMVILDYFCDFDICCVNIILLANELGVEDKLILKRLIKLFSTLDISVK